MFSSPLLMLSFISLILFIAFMLLFVTIMMVIVNCSITHLTQMATKAATSLDNVKQGREVVELYKAFNSGFGPFFLILFTQAQAVWILYFFLAITSLFTSSLETNNITPCLVLGYFGLALGQAINVLQSILENKIISG